MGNKAVTFGLKIAEIRDGERRTETMHKVLEISLRSRARGFESLSLRHIEPKISDFRLFFFQFYLIFGVHSTLSRKTPSAALRLSITFLQGYARQLQGWSKTPYF